VFAKRVNQISIGPACPARHAAAMLRRACCGPILAPPPVRAIQTWIPLESKDGRRKIILDYEGNSVYKERNYWLVLTRTLLAGFNAPIDSDFIQLAKTTFHSHPEPATSGLWAGDSVH